MRINAEVLGDVETARHLGGIAFRAGDLTEAHEAIADDFLLLEQRVWETDGSAIGVRWPRLSEQWAAFKAKRFPNAGILEMDGRLRDAMSRRGARYQVRSISPFGALLGTNLGIAGMHQEGRTVQIRTGQSGQTHAAKIPRRQFVKVDRSRHALWDSFVGEHVTVGRVRRNRRIGL